MTLDYLEESEDISKYEVKASGSIQVSTENPIDVVVDHLRNPSLEMAGFILRQIGKVKMEQKILYSLGNAIPTNEPKAYNVPIMILFPKE